MKRTILKVFLGMDILIFIVYAVCSLFLIKYDTASGITYDGFGRVLTKAPLVLRTTGLVEEWAGLGWYLLDTFCSLILIGIAYLLFTAITKNKRK